MADALLLEVGVVFLASIAVLACSYCVYQNRAKVDPETTEYEMSRFKPSATIRPLHSNELEDLSGNCNDQYGVQVVMVDGKTPMVTTTYNWSPPETEQMAAEGFPLLDLNEYSNASEDVASAAGLPKLK